MLALMPDGGSLVSLIDRSRMPIGIPADGSADNNNLKLMCEPVSPEKESNIFYSSTSHPGMRWMFCSMIQWPSLLPYSILLLATSSCPCPREMLKKDFPVSIRYLSLSFFMIFSTSLTGSEPGDSIKKMGI